MTVVYHEEDGDIEVLQTKKMGIVGYGNLGRPVAMNLRDSGCDVSYTLRQAAIAEKRQSWKNATENGFTTCQ